MYWLSTSLPSGVLMTEAFTSKEHGTPLKNSSVRLNVFSAALLLLGPTYTTNKSARGSCTFFGENIS